MNIAVNTRLLIRDKLDGIGWFTYESLRRITTQHPEHQFYFIFDRPYDPEFIFSENVTPIVQFPQARHPVLFCLWFDYFLPPVLKRLNPDLFLSPDGYLSLRTHVKSMAVIHDLNFEHYRGDLPFLTSRYYRHYFPKFAKKAIRIATVSEYSKRDIREQYGIPSEKIDIVYNGANDSFHPVPENEKESVRKTYTGGCPYFVFIGSLHPRKNLTNLFLAFERFKENTSSDVKLLIVGSRKWWTEEIDQAYQSMRHGDAVIFSGRLDPEELQKVLGSSLALVYVSYFEGFGIPIVEAYRCGTAVITSNVTSMPEVAGDAALLVDPFDTGSIFQGLMKVYQDPAFRAGLIEKGNQRKEVFTWQRTADLLWESIEKAIQST
ncbi:MAG: glycosyltransferase family 1 protein [Bacteroidota bacterium]|nr:glycosyltransferase family 1 protein [Bacteroidota bacterium]